MKAKELGLIIGATALKVVTDTLMVAVTTVALAATFPQVASNLIYRTSGFNIGLFGYEPEYDYVIDSYGPAPCYDDEPKTINGWTTK